MEEQIGQIEIGTIETERQKLKPKKVKIVSWKKTPIEKAHGEKISFEVKHPDKDENILISAVSFLEEKKIETRGTWFNLDKDGKISKGSSLAILLNKLQAKNLDETKDKEAETELDEKDYLCFKAY